MLHCNNLSFKYDNTSNIIENLTFNFKSGSINVITGKNGCGKTTLLKILSGIEKKYRGEYYFDDCNNKKMLPPELYNSVGIVFYSIEDQFICSTILDEINFVLDANGQHINTDIYRIFNLFNVSHLLNKHPDELSAGEQQKVLVCILYMLNKQILLLDEPFANLDRFEAERVYSIFEDLKNQGKIIIFSINYPYKFINPDNVVEL